jgi:BirA family biotin operon repressor/biotin-[acetyl-CoA-carboxylase] ligase
MDQSKLESALAGLPLKGIRFYDQVDSTNDLASRWAHEGAPHLALVITDEQRAGRGRAGRRWYTPAGAALAFSLVLHLPPEPGHVGVQRLSGLGALAVCQGLHEHTGLNPEIKWPNDVLLDGRKTAGVLAEIDWLGDQPRVAILGIGVNVDPASTPPNPRIDFPATSVADQVGRAVDRIALLERILTALLDWWPRVESPAFLQEWERRLAYRGGWLQIQTEGGPAVEGRILGLTTVGGLRLRLRSGAEKTFEGGVFRLRPVDSP